jgi:fermentation-respiration switch protein FrsA (DUF1100 family)
MAHRWHGGVRLWAGQRDVADPTGIRPEEEIAARTRPRGAGLALVDAAGEQRAVLGLVPPPQPRAAPEETQTWAKEPAPGLALLDASGSPRAVLRLEPLVWPKEPELPEEERAKRPAHTPSVTLLDHRRRARVVLRLDAEGHPTLRFLDEKGEVTWSAP